MRIDGGGSSTSNQPQDWTNSYTPMKVDVSDLRDYWMKMTTDLYAQAMSATTSVLAPMPQMVGAGLLGLGGKTDPEAGIFPEGVVLAQIITDTHAKFGDFFKDVSSGILCIGDAAGVVSEIYGNSDAENSASLNDVLFAFNDPTATRPADLPKDATTVSYADAQAQAANSSGQYAMALSAPDDQAIQVITPFEGLTIYLFPDGSSKQISTKSDSNSWAAGTTTTTTYYYHGQQVGTTTESQYAVRGGYSYTTTSTSPTGDQNAPGSSTTQVVTNPDGSQTITTTTIGADGKPTTSNPITVQPPPSNDSGTDSGPVQQAEQQYQTSGSNDYVQQHGSSY